MDKEIDQLSCLVCDPTVFLADTEFAFQLDRKALYVSAQFQDFSNALNADRRVERLVDSRRKNSNAHYGDIAEQVIADSIAECWRSSSLNPESLATLTKRKIEDLRSFKASGHLPVSMALLLPIHIEEEIELTIGKLMPLTEETLRHFLKVTEGDPLLWLTHGGGKAVLLTSGSCFYSELIEGNLARHPDYQDHHGLIVLLLSIITHHINLGKSISYIALEPEACVCSSTIAGSGSFSNGRMANKPQLRIRRDDMVVISSICESFLLNEFPHFPARKLFSALKGNGVLEDVLVDCVSAWEGLLLKNITDEIKFKLSILLGYLLNEDGTGVAIQKKVDNIYKNRSAIVHGDFKVDRKIQKQFNQDDNLRRNCADAVSLSKQLLQLCVKDPRVFNADSKSRIDELIRYIYR
jgi:hypothetical protein